MTADRLLRLYPRAWRERYGEEFLATAGEGALRLQQVIDIVSGAIDAWLSSEVRRSTTSSTNQGEATMHYSAFKAACGQTSLRFATRDMWLGMAVLLGGTILLSALGIFANRSGWPVTGEILKSLALPASMTLSMPVTVLKGQPWKAQVVVCGATLLMLIGAGYVASRI